MRLLVSPAGTRGDFQPMLALAAGLRDAGHQVTLASGPNFAAEAAAFGLEFKPVGIDVQAFLIDKGVQMTPLKASLALFHMGRIEIGRGIDQLLPLAKGVDLVIGAGAQICAPSAAAAAGVPYLYVAYTPQALPSRHHAPFVFPLTRGPQVANALAWSSFLLLTRAAFRKPLDAKHKALGLAPVRDYQDHFFPSQRTILAADPELAPIPPDCKLSYPATGSLHLPDARPLGPELEAFLAAGPAPCYIGFGSMPIRDPAGTTRLVLEATQRAGVRVILSAGWGGLGGAELGSNVMLIGPTSHSLLFPRLACVVHHGGAGTTSAAARAGVPQILIPHAFDQFMWGQLVSDAGVGPAPITRSKLSAQALCQAIRQTQQAGLRERAQQLGAALRARDGVKNVVALLPQVAADLGVAHKLQ